MAAAPIAWEALAQWLLGRLDELMPQWFPAATAQGREWCIGDLKGDPGQSLRINRDSGLWSDFATGQKGRDLIALWAAMRGLNQLDAAKDLAQKYGYGSIDTTVVALRPAVSDLEAHPFENPPAGAPITAVSFKHPKWGIPTQIYPYRAADRHLIYVVARYELLEGKQFSPWTWREKWRPKGPPSPRPLYGLDRLEGLPGATIIVEGEKAADSLQARTQRSSVLSWGGGANAWKHHDWSLLRGRACILWPDADTPGFAAMQGIAGVLLALGCTLQLIDTEGLPEAFDAADLTLEGGELNTWIRARLRPVERPTSAPAQVQAPTDVRGAVTVDEHGTPVNGAPAYSVAARYGLSYNKAGVHANLANARALIEGRVTEGGWEPLHYDEFLQKTVVSGSHPREWSDQDTLRLTDQMQRHFGMTQLRKGVVEDAVTLYAFQHRRNSAQEWLNSLRHDGTQRLEHLFTRGFGSVENEYTRKAAKCFMLGMVARVLDPGCQVDTLPVLESAQGERKSTALRTLGGEYFAECHESMMGKDFYLVLHGKMLIEIADFHVITAADVDRTKGIISNRDDRYRAPYERRASDHPRSCVLIATTNRDDWNRDDTGARRYWPIVCAAIDVDWIKKHREQFFAEAVARYRSGESWWDIPLDMARAEQSNRRPEDVLSRALQHYCANRTEINVGELMDANLDLKGIQRFDRQVSQRLTSTLRSWGYRPLVKRDGTGKSVRVWLAPETPTQLTLEPDEPM